MKTKSLFISLLIIILVVLGLWIIKTPKVPPRVELIQVDAPLANSIVTSPLIITGLARGSFYFEAVFPVRLVDGTGVTLAQGQARANPPTGGDWMTEEFVPFRATLTFTNPLTETGTLILQNDNPSGLPENSRQVRIPIRFITAPATSGSSGIIGYFHLGPTCPVERNPPDPNCADKPYAQATVVITNALDGQYKYKSETDATGHFRLSVPAGKYTVTATPSNILPRCEEQVAIVAADKFIDIDISCDTGIR